MPRASKPPPKMTKAERAARRTERLGPVLLNQKQLAIVLGVSGSSIREFVHDGMPPPKGRNYDATACVKWRIDYLVSRAANGPKAKGSAPLARQGLIESQKARLDLEIAKLREEVMDRQLHTRIIQEIASMLASRLDGLGPRLAGELAGSDDPAFIQQRLFDEHRSIRATLAADVRKLSKELASEAEALDDGEAAA